MTRIATLATLAFSLLASPALAKGEIPFEKVKGWEIERSPNKAGPACLMSKTYKDKDDNNAENAVVFALAGDQMIVSLGYQHWTWDKDEKVEVPMALDKKVVNKKSAWTGDGQNLTGQFPASLVPNMLAAKLLVLKFEDSDADFDLSGFPEAYESLRRCDVAPAKAEAAPATPSEARIKAFYLGSMVASAIKECDMPTTGKQRTAFDQKLSALRAEMGPIAPEIQTQIDKRPEPRCPNGDSLAKAQQAFQDFIDKTPEDFIAIVEKRVDEDAAAAKAKGATPDAPKP